MTTTESLTYGDVNETTMRVAGEVMLHVASRCDDDDAFEMVRLSKTLWRAERRCYVELGQPLTGSRYISLAKGPVLDDYRRVIDRLVREQAATVEVARWEQVLRPLRDPDLSHLLPEQIAILNEVIDDDMNKPAWQLAEESHGKAWHIELHDDTGIPYDAFGLSKEPLTAEERERVLELKRQFSW